MITLLIHYARDISPRTILDLIGDHRRAYQIGPDLAVDCRNREEADLMANRFKFQPGMSATLMENGHPLYGS